MKKIFTFSIAAVLAAVLFTSCAKEKIPDNRSFWLSQESGDVVSGTDPGAPAIPRLIAKIIWTTIVTTVLFCGFYALFASRLVTFDDILSLFGMPH